MRKVLIPTIVISCIMLVACSIVSLLPISGAASNPTIAEMLSKVSESEIYNATYHLQNFTSRKTGQPGNEEAGTFIYDKLVSLGIAVEYQGGTIRNVIATLPGKDTSSNAVYMVGAHYDSISTNPSIAPGATDNGGGVAIILELARIMAQYDFNHTLKFAFWNEEEQGNLGSLSYVRSLTGTNVSFYFNYDSAVLGGPNPAKYLDIMCDDQSIADMLTQCNALYNIGLQLNYNGHYGHGVTCLSDYVPFKNAGVSWVMTHSQVTAGTPTPDDSADHAYQHTPDDTIDKVSTAFAKMNCQIGMSILAQLAEVQSSSVPPSSQEWYFGRTNITGASVDGEFNNIKEASRFLCTQNGTLARISLYCRAYDRGGAVHAKGAVFIDSSNNDNSSLLGTSSEATIQSAFSWTNFTFATGIPVSSETYYWFSFLTDGFIFLYRMPGKNNMIYNDDLYFDGFSDPFGSHSDYNSELCIYATCFTPLPPPLSHYQMTFDHRDLDDNVVDSRITWVLFNGSQRLNYAEGAPTLLAGAYILETCYHNQLINRTVLRTSLHGNSTVKVSLQMKPHLSVPNGYLAFNRTVSSLSITTQNDSDLTFVAGGAPPILIIADAPRNCSYVQRDGINQTGWIYTQGSPSYISLTSTSFSTWNFHFPKPSLNPIPLFAQSLCCAVFVVFFCFALRAELRMRSIKAPLFDIRRILRAILAPMPVVNVASLHVLHHSSTTSMSLPILIGRCPAITFPQD